MTARDKAIEALKPFAAIAAKWRNPEKGEQIFLRMHGEDYSTRMVAAPFIAAAEALLALQSEPAPPQDWRPIEEAKNDTVYWLYGRISSYYNDVRDGMVLGVRTGGERWKVTGYNGYEEAFINPILFMPLPAPPKIEGEG